MHSAALPMTVCGYTKSEFHIGHISSGLVSNTHVAVLRLPFIIVKYMNMVENDFVSWDIMLTGQSSDMSQGELTVMQQGRMYNWGSMHATYEMHGMIQKIASGVKKPPQITPIKN